MFEAVLLKVMSVAVFGLMESRMDRLLPVALSAGGDDDEEDEADDEEDEKGEAAFGLAVGSGVGSLLPQQTLKVTFMLLFLHFPPTLFPNPSGDPLDVVIK